MASIKKTSQLERNLLKNEFLLFLIAAIMVICLIECYLIIKHQFYLIH
jgi:hypothetical protein